MGEIDEFADQMLVDLFREAPDLAEMAGLPDLVDTEIADEKFGDLSDETARKFQDLVAAKHDEWRRLPKRDLDEQQRITADVVDFFLTKGNLDPFRGVDGHAFMYHGYPVNHISGPQNELPVCLANQFPVTVKQSAERYIGRLARFRRAFEQLVDALQLRRERGIVVPRLSIDHVIQDLKAFLAPAPAENLLTTSFRSKLAATGLSEVERNDLSNRAEGGVRDVVYPAYRLLISHLEDLRTDAPEEVGTFNLPDGDLYYAFLLEGFTTTDLTPDRIHDLGREKLALLHDEIRSGFHRLGYRGRSIPELYQQISGDEFRYPNDADGRAQMLDDARSLVDDIKAKMPEIFDLIPRADCIVEPIPEPFESSMTSQYRAPAKDGSRPGIYYINLHQHLKHPKWDLMPLSYHEAVPGHHFQITIAQELESLSLFRRTMVFGAYLEGWAKYAETIPWTHGYNTDPIGALARMRFEVFSTANLVMDTGIHHKGWTPEEAIGFHMESTGSEEESSRRMVERLIVWPGQACAYKIGYITMQKMKARMEEALGDRFAIKRFHNAVLGNGALPLSVLERVVEADAAKGQ